jgi:hypothetical protein
MFGHHQSTPRHWPPLWRPLLGAWLAVNAVACSADETSGPGGAGGSSGSGGAGGSTSDCRPRGVGSIDVRITGLPAGVDAELVVGGPVEAIGVSADRTLLVAAGPYQITPARVAAPDPVVRTLFEPVLETREFCLREDETRRVEVSYVPVATSHKLWTNASNGSGNLLGFEASSLVSSADIGADVSLITGAGKDVAFDKLGNLWSMGGTVADPHLMRFPVSRANGSGTAEHDRSIDIEGLACLPALRAFAFDRGSLWVSTCGSGVVALSAAELEASGQVTPQIRIGGATENGDIAFDISRNLWVTDGETLLRYDAERLEASIDTPDLRLSVRDAADERGVTPSNLAFDSAGNLWITDFGGNVVSQVASTDLAGTGEKTAISAVSITLGVTALLEGPAFDESGGLWIALEANRFGRLSPAQLRLSSGPGTTTEPETIITSASMGNANRMALFPAPQDLPLYHRFP